MPPCCLSRLVLTRFHSTLWTTQVIPNIYLVHDLSADNNIVVCITAGSISHHQEEWSSLIGQGSNDTHGAHHQPQPPVLVQRLSVDEAYATRDLNPTSIGSKQARTQKRKCSPFRRVYEDSVSNLNYQLPETVKAVREGWQWTCQSGAVVSGLLAAVAAQLLVFFKTDSSYSLHIHVDGGAKGFLLGSCYIALFLNISATISSFILIDNLGEIGFKASCKNLNPPLRGSTETTNENKLLIQYGASLEWNWMLYHWVITFYSGILALMISVLTYVMMEESFAMKVVMGLTLGLTLGPLSWFILFRPLIGH